MADPTSTEITIVGHKPKDTTAKPPRSNWAIFLPGGRNSGIYVLTLLDTRNLQGGATVNGLSRNNAPNEFIFSVNPKNLSLEEPAAVTIVPTQSGLFIEHQGQIFKNVSIGGTTGLRPNRTNKGGIIPIINVAIPDLGLNLDRETGLPRGERTGFDDLIDLRNLFRRYWDKKVDNEDAPHTIMVWQNGKEGEYYIVEPIAFRTTRDSSSPITFSYDIQLRTIERLNINKLLKRKDPLTAKQGLSQFFSRMNEARLRVSSAFATVSLALDRISTVGSAITTQVLTPAQQLLQQLNGIIVGGSKILTIPRTTLTTMANEALVLSAQLDAIQAITFSGGAPEQLTGITIASNSIKSMARQFHVVAAEDSLFQSAVSTVLNTKTSQYFDPITGTQPSTGGSLTYLGNAARPASASVSAVNSDEDIKKLSLRLLGDVARWKELVVLNKLIPPYISTAGDGVSVLRPGNAILVPSASPPGPNGISKSDLRPTGESNLDKRLGRDLRLSVTQSIGNVSIYDIAVQPSGDLDVVSGKPNMEQAITIKFGTEQGELPTHPSFGLRAPIGRKAKVQTLVEFQLNARSTLLSDSRIGSVDRLNVSFEGNTVHVDAAASLVGSDSSLIVDFNVRR